MLKFYGYPACGTCRKASKWLDAQGIAYDYIDITKQPPSPEQLRQIVEAGRYSLRQLFNTSGQLYRSMDIKTRLPQLSQDQAIDLLAGHGKLIKRPIVLGSQGRHTVGFRENEFADTWK